MKKLYVLFIAMFMCAGAFAQVTTSSMSGTVMEPNGISAVGATVVAVHTPSGTSYGTVVDAGGYYRIVNMRPGGPYRITISLLGYKTIIAEGIDIPLGQNYVLQGELVEDTLGIEEVVVMAQGAIMNSDRTGAATNVDSRQIQSLPSLNRSLNDFTRLTPQAGLSGAFGGRDTRYNNVTIDGAAFSQRFGLSTSNNLPGGDAQPISLDAIQEISVSLTPFDIRQSNFTGANINAITKSGTNKYTATAYTYLRPKSFNGTKSGDLEIPGTRESSLHSYGVSVGGPIIKNKLFFYVNGEIEGSSKTGNYWVPSQDGVPNKDKSISAVKESDMKRVYDYLKSKYNYDAGNYNSRDKFNSDNYKIFARLDWNIDDIHKVMIRYNMVNSSNDIITNNSSRPNGSPSVGGNRNGEYARSFANSYYQMTNRVQSLTGEWNANFSPKVQNKLLASFTNIRDKRETPGDLFPFVDILDGNGNYHMSFGTELFSHNNAVTNNTFNITNNTTISLGSHTLTAGLSYEHQYFGNSYQREGTSYYRYKNIDDFLNDATPLVFAYQMPYKDGEIPVSELTFGLASIYVQDEWNVTRNLKLTGGLRLEMPFYYTDLQGPTKMMIGGTERNVSDMEFVNGEKIDLAKWPKSRPLFSPRLGFNWDVYGDKSLQVRGGTGIFTGMMPFVWFTNQPQSASFVQSPETSLSGSAVAGLTFNPNFREQVFNSSIINAPTPGLAPFGSGLAKVGEDFKLPQLWRSSLAVDLELPWKTVLTVEAMYSKDINAVTQRNINLKNADNNYSGPDTRPYYSSNKMYNEVSSAMVLSNINKGYQASFTAQLTKNFFRGFSGMVAYTYTIAKDATANPGSVAFSAWSANSTAVDMNNPEIGYSNFAVPHRVVGYLSYSIEWLRHARTTVSLFYNGNHTGKVSYTYSNDANGDGISGDLIYIPKDVSEMKFVDITKDGNVTYSATQQATDFETFINDTPYLKKNRGKYAERYADTRPWSNRFDVKILQDVFANFGRDNRLTLQFSLDIINVGNLINKNWGVGSYYGSLMNYDNMRLLTSKGANSNGELSYTLFANDSADFKKKAEWQTSSSSSLNVWGIQLGFRLIF